MITLDNVNMVNLQQRLRLQRAMKCRQTPQGSGGVVAEKTADGSCDRVAIDVPVVVTSEGGTLSVSPVEELELGANDQKGEFERLDCIVRKAARAFDDAGRALKEIRDRELWRFGDHPSWDDYCESIAALTRRHANRLIQAHEVVEALAQVGPRGPTLLAAMPQSEFQVRPLLRLKNDGERAGAWARALEVAQGQPSAKVVTQVVAEILDQQTGPKTAVKTRTQQRQEIFAELKTALSGLTDERVRDLLDRLEPFIL
jgi:hypothetical protein